MEVNCAYRSNYDKILMFGFSLFIRFRVYCYGLDNFIFGWVNIFVVEMVRKILEFVVIFDIGLFFFFMEFFKLRMWLKIEFIS